MELNNIKAVSVDIDVNDDLLNSELLNIPENYWDAGYDEKSHHYWKSIFLTKNNIQDYKDFKSAKIIDHANWFWDSRLEIPYIKSLVEGLPIKTIGMIRAFILNGPLVMHTDTNENTPNDISYKLGLTIASKLHDPMSISDIVIKEKYLFFNDSIPHGFPNSNSQQISIRVFGDFDYDSFKVIKEYK
jgi:hypothetical protein